jgi:hypothetical protein
VPEASSGSATKETPVDGAAGRLVPLRIGLPLLITFAAIALVGVVCFNSYRGQDKYFTGRNLRLLSMLTSQIDGRMEMYSGFARNPNPNSAREEMTSVRCSPPNSSGDLRRDILPSASGWNVMLQTANVAGYVIPLESVLRPVFGRRTGMAFDVLVVARDDGVVLYSTRQAPNTSTLLHHEEEWIDEETEEPHIGKPEGPEERSAATKASDAQTTAAERESTSTLMLTNLRALSEVSGWRDTAPLKLETLLRANARTEVALGREEYVLFTQPYTFAMPAVTVDHKARQWVVCGLVSATRFRDDALAISATVALIAAALAILALCCWPFLRIALIDCGQALTITDVVLLIVCTVVGVAVITLALLDGFSYERMSNLADKQLKDYGEQLNRDFRDNIGRASDMLAAVERITKDAAVTFAKREPKPSHGDKLPKELLSDDTIKRYPYIHSIQWVDSAGMQQARFDRVPGPLQNVGDRQYFQLAMHDRMSSVGGKDYILQWVHSRSSGEVTAELAKKIDVQVPEFAVVGVNTELIDISHPVPPPGVQMAIIDESGEVIYHSDVERIGYENFLVEADRNRDLRAALLARRPASVYAKYWGEDQAMYVRPLSGSMWTLVTFRPTRLTRVLNVEGALLTIMLLLACAMPLLLLAIVVLLVYPGYRAPRLWPSIARTRDYARLAIVLVALLLLFWVDMYAWAPSSSWGILILPTLAFVSTYVLLHRTGAERRYRIGIGVWIALQACFISHVLVADADPIHRFGHDPWELRIGLILAGIVVALLPLDIRFLHDRGRRVANELRSLSVKAGYSRLYRLCGALLLMVGVAMPVAGLFAISRRLESQLLVKYAQLRAAADIEHRVDQLITLNAFDELEPVTDDVLCRSLEYIFDSGWGLRPETRPAPMQPANTSPEQTGAAPEARGRPNHPSMAG